MKNREPFENYSPITRFLLKLEGDLAVWTAIWIPHILYWRISEERQLERKYKNYQEYKRKTWF